MDGTVEPGGRVLGGYVLLYGPGGAAVPRTRFPLCMLPSAPFMALGLVAVLWRVLPLVPSFSSRSGA
jgi:hypothetical protein